MSTASTNRSAAFPARRAEAAEFGQKPPNCVAVSGVPARAEQAADKKPADAVATQAAPAPAGFPPLMLIDTETLSARARIDATFGAFAYQKSFYGVPKAPEPFYRMSHTYAEGWLAPGVEATLRPTSAFETYGGLSVGSVRTFGSDILRFAMNPRADSRTPISACARSSTRTD